MNHKHQILYGYHVIRRHKPQLFLDVVPCSSMCLVFL